jgi:hypothetical protein
MMCKPEKLKESIEYFKIASEVFPDIVALNQIALGFEMLGETEKARDYFTQMKTQAESENSEAYLVAAEQGIA